MQQRTVCTSTNLINHLPCHTPPLQDLFIKYYDAVLPLLSNILLHATDKAHRLLRAKALECISLVGMAVGKDRFRAGDAARLSCRLVVCDL